MASQIPPSGGEHKPPTPLSTTFLEVPQIDDTQVLRTRIAGIVTKVFNDAPPLAKRVSTIRDKDKTQWAIFSGKGETLEEVLNIVEKCNPRLILALNIRIKEEPPHKTEFKKISQGFLVHDMTAQSLISNLLHVGRRSITAPPEEVLSAILTSPGVGFGFITILTEPEKLQAMRGLGVSEAHSPLMAARLTELLLDQPRLARTAAAMQKRRNEIVAMRKQAGVPDNQSAEYWTEERIAALNPVSFWNEECRHQNSHLSKYNTVQTEVGNEWKSLNKNERDIYSRLLPLVGQQLATSVFAMHYAIRDVASDELKLIERKNKLHESVMSSTASVNPNSPEFQSQLQGVKEKNTEFLRLYGLCSQWGQGLPELELLEGLRAMLEERPRVLPEINSSREISQHLKTFLAEERRYHRRSMMDYLHMNPFIDNVTALNQRNHDLASAVWRAVKPEGIAPGDVNIWGGLLFVTKEGVTPEVERDYHEVTFPLLMANAGKPFIADYARAISNPMAFHDSNSQVHFQELDSMLTQDYIDMLGRMPVESATTMLRLFRIRHAGEYLTPASEAGRNVLAAVEQNPRLLNPLAEADNSPASQKYALDYLKAISEPPYRQVLGSIAGKPYQSPFARVYVTSADSRSVLSAQQFIQQLDDMETQRPGNARDYLSLLALEGVERHLLSETARQILLEDPQNISLLGRMELGALKKIAPHLARPENRNFFTPDVIANLTERSGEVNQWAVAEAALAELGGAL